MGRHLHFDCFSGVSGDMVLGALVSAGLSWRGLINGLKHLRLSGYQLRKREVHRGALPAIKVDVIVQQGFQRPLTLSRIRKILTGSTLPGPVKERSRSVFDRLAEAESLAHRVDMKDVHFHEVGVVDSFIDVVGGVLGCYLLNATRITSSPINVGAGSIQTSHGLLPVPGPAVAVLAKGIPIYATGPRSELATPTGVALLSGGCGFVYRCRWRCAGLLSLERHPHHIVPHQCRGRFHSDLTRALTGSGPRCGGTGEGNPNLRHWPPQRTRNSHRGCAASDIGVGIRPYADHEKCGGRLRSRRPQSRRVAQRPARVSGRRILVGGTPDRTDDAD